MQEIRFAVDVLPRPRAEATFRAAVREAAVRAFGTERFWNEVWVYAELTFVAHAKWQVRGDLDNYAKNVLDALCGVAYQDDGQVSGIHFDWVDDHVAGATIRVQGADLFDAAELEEFTIRVRGRAFTFLLPRTAGEDLRGELRQHYRERVKTYYDMIKRGIPERDARGIWPIVNYKYRRKGRRPVANNS